MTSEKKKIEAKLVDQKDYMDIKRECEILKDTQFSGTEKTKLESQTLEGFVLDLIMLGFVHTFSCISVIVQKQNVNELKHFYFRKIEISKVKILPCENKLMKSMENWIMFKLGKIFSKIKSKIRFEMTRNYQSQLNCIFRMLSLKSWKRIYCRWMPFQVHIELLVMVPHQLRQMFSMNFLKMLSRKVLKIRLIIIILA